MRKWNLILFCLTVVSGILLMAGCEGDSGVGGVKGVKGRKGDSGVDPQLAQPASRYFAVGVTNASKNAVDGKKKLYLTFDSTARATRDTMVANRVFQPPLIDGKDGDEFEWGTQKSKTKLSFLNPDSGIIDPKITDLTCRAAYDQDYIYMFFQWKEQKIAVRDSIGKEKVIYNTSPTEETDELFFSGLDSIAGKPKWIRPKRDSVGDSCIWIPILDSDPPDSTCRKNVIYQRDTVYIWLPSGKADDRLVVFWGDESASDWSAWADDAFRNYFEFSGSPAALPANAFIDIWVWGAATTKPVGSADDWMMTSMGLSPDAGRAPYILNWVFPDSVPRYQNRLDPNIRTNSTPSAVTYPLWYYNAVGYSFKNWDKYRICFLPGIITTIPSDSRADVYAMADFDNTTFVWTLEMRRARNTNSGDDVQF